ncbi:MAG TPA: right-handed parallel beta-helix repeat-containing protein [Longimicrobiales bacterium]|nr:right-handed parallel beta-helix repeat-containing protein [Longimicrobiales bacterium]
MLRIIARSSLLAILALALTLACSDSSTGPGKGSGGGSGTRPSYTLSVQLEGDGAGTITSSPAGITCTAQGGTCSASFDSATSVTLTASADSGDDFAGWSGDCSGSATCALTMSKAMSATGSFDNPRKVEATLGTSGGTLVSSDSLVTLTIPAGALDSAQQISIEATDGSELGAQWDSVLTLPGATTYEMEPSGLTFVVPLTLEFKSDQSPTTSGDTLGMHPEFMLTDSAGTVSSLDSVATTMDTSGVIKVTGQVHHFSPFMRALSPARLIFTGPHQVAVGESFRIRYQLVSGGDVQMLNPGIDEAQGFGATSRAEGVLTLSTVQPGMEYTADGNVATCTTAGEGQLGAAASYVDDFTPNNATTNVGNIFVLTCVDGGSTLTVTTAGDGTGTVTSDPPGIDCADNCSTKYLGGRTVTLTAAPDDGSTFAGWSGDCTGTDASTSITIQDGTDASCTATFTSTSVVDDLQLIVEGGGTGTVTSDPAGMTCQKTDVSTDVTCDASFADGTQVTLTSTVDAGMEDGAWTGCDSSTPTTCTITMAPGVAPVHKAYSLGWFTVTLTKSGTGSGTVSIPGEAGSIYPPHTCGTDCTSQWHPGDVASVNETPEAGSIFAGWSGDCTGTASDQSINVTVTNDMTCNAQFDVDPNAVTVNLSVLVDVASGRGGAITSSVESGSSSSASVDVGVSSAGGSSLRDRTRGSIALATGDSSINCTVSGGVCSVDVPQGTVLRLHAQPDAGAYLYGWYDAGVTDTTTNDRLVTMNADTTVSAVFMGLQPTISSVTVEGGSNMVPNNRQFVIDVKGTNFYKVSAYLSSAMDTGVVLGLTNDSVRIQLTSNHRYTGPLTLHLSTDCCIASPVDSAVMMTPLTVSPAGDDSALGATDTPFRTIARALEFAARGDTVQLTAGDFNTGETWNYHIPGIVIRGAGSDSTTLHGAGGDTAFVVADDPLGYYAAIDSLTVTGFAVGVFTSVDGAVYYDFGAAANTDAGLDQAAVHTVLHDAVVTDNPGVGIRGSAYLWGGVVSHNGVGLEGAPVWADSTRFVGNGIAVHVTTSQGATLTGVAVDSTTGAAGVQADSGNVNMTGGSITNSVGWGMVQIGNTGVVWQASITDNATGGLQFFESAADVENSHVDRNGVGVQIQVPSGASYYQYLYGNTFSDNTAQGLLVDSVAGTVDAQYDTIIGNGAEGVRVVHYAANMALQFDTVDSNTLDGVRFDGAGYVQFWDGALTNNGGAGIAVSQTVADPSGGYPVLNVSNTALFGNTDFQLLDERPAGATAASSYIYAGSDTWGSSTAPSGLMTGPASATDGVIKLWKILNTGEQIYFTP